MSRLGHHHPVTGQPLYTGALRAKPGHPMLSLANYLSPGAPLPAQVDWSAFTQTWPDFGNNQYGCCVETTKADFVMIFSWHGLGKLNIPARSTVVNTYFAETGGPDVGLDVPTSLDYWLKNPLQGDRLAAWAQIDPKNVTQVQTAIAYFGGVFAVCVLPQNFPDGLRGHLWYDYTQPFGNSAHCFPLFGYNATSAIGKTWTQTQAATWDWLAKFCVEMYVPLGFDWESKNVAPSGIAVPELIADFNALKGGQVIPPVIPVIPPVIPPTPTVYNVLGGSMNLVQTGPGTYTIQGGVLTLK